MAKEQQALMIELFRNIGKMEMGEQKKPKKSTRRSPDQIVQKHSCPYQYCQRFYSSESCLRRHMKQKHDLKGDKHVIKCQFDERVDSLSQLYFNGGQSNNQSSQRDRISKKKDFMSIRGGGK